MYEIFALKVGERPTDSPKVFMHTDYGKQFLTVFYFWLLKSETQNILVDTGISQEELQCRKISGPTREEMLSRLGLGPEDIDAVIVSHLHGDHFAEPEIYSKALFYIQRKEVEYWSGEVLGFASVSKPDFLHGKAAVQLDAFQKLNLEGRVDFLDGDCEIYPGINSVFTGGHTPGHQAVKVETQRGPVLLCVDFADAYRNMSERIPVGTFTSLEEWLSGCTRIERMRLPLESLVPGHDELVMEKFPEVAKDIVKIA